MQQLFTQLSSVSEAAYRNTQDGQPDWSSARGRQLDSSPPHTHPHTQRGPASEVSVLSRRQCKSDGHVTAPAQNLSLATANVCTSRPRQLRQVLGGSTGAGVSTKLDEVFSSAGLHIVALQECRTQSDRIMRGSHYTMYKTSADVHVFYGTQMWTLSPESHEMCHAICSHQPTHAAHHVVYRWQNITHHL